MNYITLADDLNSDSPIFKKIINWMTSEFGMSEIQAYDYMDKEKDDNGITLWNNKSYISIITYKYESRDYVKISHINLSKLDASPRKFKLTTGYAINKFIKTRFKNDCNWTNGNCIWFAILLNNRFPDTDIYYMPSKGHFVIGITNYKNTKYSFGNEYESDFETEYYDWLGKVSKKDLKKELNEPISLSLIKFVDPLWYDHLMRDCYE